MAEIVEGARENSLIHWSAVIAGAVAAAALSFVLITFGASIGLSLVSPWPGQSYSRTALSIAAAWALIVPIASLLVGGYIAGRMRPRAEMLNSDESEFRDGLHGLLVWGVSLALGLVLAMGAASLAANVGSSMTRFYDRAAPSPLTDVVDRMMRPVTGAGAPSARAAAESDRAVQRAFAASLTPGGLTPDNRSYLAQVVAQRAGIPVPEAEARVDKAYASGVEALDRARKATVLAGLVTGVALMLALAAAWYAAIQGGQHRDQRTPLRIPIRTVTIVTRRRGAEAPERSVDQ